MSSRIVALPGTLCAPAVFDPLSRAVADWASLRAVSWMTQPGPWDIPTVAARVAAELESPVVLIGHSTGGAIAQQLALTHPDLVEALVLIDSGAHMREHGDVGRILDLVRDDWGETLWTAVLDRSFAQRPEPEVWTGLLRYASRVDPRAAYEVLSSQRDLDFEPRLRELNMPVLVIHGTRDPVRTVEQARGFAAAIPGARLEFVDAGHSPMYEVAGQVAEMLRTLAGESVPGVDGTVAR